MSEKEFVVSVEELISRNDHDQSPAVSKEGAIPETEKNVTVTNVSQDESDVGIPEIDDLEIYLLGHVNRESPTPQVNTSTTVKPKIQKVPTILRGRENFGKFYEPRVVSFGPIHHDKHKFISEVYKKRFFAGFVERSGRDYKDLYKTIEDKISELKKLFDDDVIEVYGDDKALSRMLFLDGCFILMFIVSYVDGDFSSFNITNVHAAYIQQDLFLLENQIPFLVLKLLTESSSPEFKKKLETSIRDFILDNILAPREPTWILNFELDKLKPDSATHLLEMLQMSATGLLIRKTFESSPPNRSACDRSTPVVQPYFRSVQKLQAAGIHLKPTRRHFLTDMDFHSQVFTASLALPPLLVDDSTGPKLMNLIAYEMCPDNRRTNYEVTSYICFMNSLIDDADDVKELRLSNILYNLLGNDKQVASLFAEIATGLVPNPEIYKDVKKRIENHHHRKLRVWMTETFNKWPVMAFFAALFSLMLSVIQTWYAIPFGKSSHK
ncbi:hypothetical protein PanWU01x14_362880 [Parasponia andersonii]|uniref:Uncharacterized protein n=1 Tax=Parasponia andersonii TaxID=3476 RepID=A0A2P5A6U0_PARAD|nr:hypothetical protein PanWU01x14_362880 [Parasponia andersonii]